MPPGKFYELLELLTEEHEQALQELRHLRTELESGGMLITNSATASSSISLDDLQLSLSPPVNVLKALNAFVPCERSAIREKKIALSDNLNSLEERHQVDAQVHVKQSIDDDAYVHQDVFPIVECKEDSQLAQSEKPELSWTSQGNHSGFVLHDVWKSSSHAASFMKGNHAHWTLNASEFGEGFAKKSGSRRWQETQRAFILTPGSKKRIFWDVLGIIALMFDMVRLPLRAFPIKQTGADDVLDWFARIFWTVDIPASLCVGFYKRGELILDFHQICRMYLKTWFTLDIGLVVSDWLIYVLEETSPANSSSNANFYVKLVRFARFARLLRLARVLKVQTMLQSLEDLIDTQNLAIYVRLLKPAIFIVCINHVLACGWYGIGTLDVHQTNWIAQHVPVRNSHSVGYLYMTSLHWSFSQFTVSTMDVFAHNFTERLFTVIVMLCGLSSFSSLLSGVTSAVEELRELKTDETRSLWILRRYLKDYGISKKLSVRIIKYCDYSYSELRKRVQETDVYLLSLLSESLREQLQTEIQLPHLVLHPLLQKMVSLSPGDLSIMDKICSRALATIPVARSDFVYRGGSCGTRMFFVVDGELWYVPMASSNGDSLGIQHVDVNAGMWASEAVLWTTWIHRGDLRAVKQGHLMCLEASPFCEVMQKSMPCTFDFARNYATSFVSLLNSLDASLLTDIMQAESNQIVAQFQKAEEGDTRQKFRQKAFTAKSMFFGERGTIQKTARKTGKLIVKTLTNR